MVTVPNRCIWCKKGSPDVTFNTLSHVLPNCVGNEMQQILPKGVVCDKCNNYFGQKVEPALVNDPIFHIIAVLLKIKHPKKDKLFRERIFDENHEAIKGEHQTIRCVTEISDSAITLDINYSTKGKMTKTYDLRDLAFLSRAVHKITFESMAWSIFVKDSPKTMMKDVDIFDPKFDITRKWARFGDPTNSVRPVLRLQKLDTIDGNWEHRVWGHDGELFGELRLFGDWYGVSFTSSPDKAGNDLKNFFGKKKSGTNVWCISNNLKTLESMA